LSYSAGQRKTHKTAVVLIPPQETWPPIQAIRRAHDRHFRRWMPHITLIYPFRPRPAFEALADRFARACAQISPFEVEMAALGWFQHRSSYTLWLAPGPKETFVRLQTALWRVAPDCDDTRRHKGGFTPHLSLGQVRGREALEDLFDELQSEWTPIRFRASEISLIWRDDPPDDLFQVGRSVGLGGTIR
jgi:2'-5' RNA ligase